MRSAYCQLPTKRPLAVNVPLSPRSGGALFACRIWFPAACVFLGCLSPVMADEGDPTVDRQRLAAAGIRMIEGEFLTLYTDLPQSTEVDALPGLVAQALPQWRDFFDWKVAQPASMQGCLMHARERFEQAGLLPAELPSFGHGYCRGHWLWLDDQPSDYYRRHLLLHEATHSVAAQMFGAQGPPWYAEGVAELLGTHSLADGRLELGYLPENREEVPQWGRIKIVRDAIAKGKSLSLPDVLDFSTRSHASVEPYGWCWALATLLDKHPRYHQRFRQLAPDAARGDFTSRFRRLYAEEWADLCEEWLVFTDALEYGMDVERFAIEFADGREQPGAATTVSVRADRGWQGTGIALAAGQSYRLKATGRFQLGLEPRIWWSEPGGVTLRYYRGRPLGRLLAAVRSEQKPGARSSPLTEPIEVGLSTTIKPDADGTLYLRVNDSPAELDDNEGTLNVQVTPS